MSAVETVRLNREDFVTWLAKSLSSGPIQPTRGDAGPEKPTDVILAYMREAPDAWPVVCVPEAQMQDLFAFVFTYTKTRPFTAFFRVLPLDLVSVLGPRKKKEFNRSALAKCVAGAAMAEAWTTSAREADRPKSVFPLLLSSASATLGQVALAGYDETAFDWALKEWTELQEMSGDTSRRQDVEAASIPWRLLSASTKTLPPRTGESDLIVNFMSTALIRGALQPDMLRQLAPLTGSLNLLTLLTSSREERITRFNEFVADLKRRSERGVMAQFLAGLMLAIAGNGNLELLRSTRDFDGWLDSAVTWFGILAALFEEGNVLTYADSAGRRLVRDICRFDDPFTPPRADIASGEFRFLSGSGALPQIVARAQGTFDVEILPNVVSCVAGAAIENDGRRRRDEINLLLRNLDEAGYLIGRAREIAIGYDPEERQGSLVKSRRVRSR